MKTITVKPKGGGAQKTVARPGAVSTVGPSGAAPAPRVKNTRDYGKATPAPSNGAANPFGITDGGSRLGGI